MKLFFYGSEMLSQLEYQQVAVQTQEELSYLREVEGQMLSVINQFGLSGLAAPQLGVPIQMIVVRRAGGAKLTLLNPVIDRMYGSETDYPESCISVQPGANECYVARMQFINVVGNSLEEPSKEKNWHFTSSDARVVQHQIDHLHGTFFFDRAELVEKAKVLDRFHQWKRTFRNNPNFGGEFNGRHSSSKA